MIKKYINILKPLLYRDDIHICVSEKLGAKYFNYKKSNPPFLHPKMKKYCFSISFTDEEDEKGLCFSIHPYDYEISEKNVKIVLKRIKWRNFS